MNTSFAARVTRVVSDAMSAEPDGGTKWVLVARELLDEHEDRALVADTLATWLRDQFAAIHTVPVVPAPYAGLLAAAIDQVRWNTIAWRLVYSAEALNEQGD